MDIHQAKQRIEQLRKEIEEHNYRYYILNQPTISDYEFDQLMHELIELEKKYPQFDDPNSPSKRVGGSITKEFPTETHEYPMYSLDNVYSSEELNEFHNRVVKTLGELPLYTCELKYDGIAISILYENGIFVKAITRGDGIRGDDISNNVKTVRSIPLKLHQDYPEKLYARGEIYMPKKEFLRINKEREEIAEPPFANPRNATGGTLKLQDSAEVARRRLEGVIYYIISDSLNEDSHFKTLQLARKWGFNVPNFEKNYIKLCHSLQEIKEFIQYWETRRNELPFEVDGVVIKVDSIRQREILGFTSKAPRWAIAFKYKPEQAETELISVDFQVGRTGIITPVANLKPVLLAGTVVKRASLYNADQLEKMDLHVGDTVVVEKGGEIIPKIVEIKAEKRKPGSTKIHFVTHCPACGSKLKRDESQALVFCPNEWGCPPQLKGKIIHFTQRKAMNIEGLGEETVELLFEKNLIKTIADIYHLKKEDLLKLERWAEKSSSNLIEAIEKSKNVPFERVLFALGIRHVGETTAKKLARKFGSLDALMNASKEELMQTEDIGEIIADSIIAFFKDPHNQKIIQELKKAGLQFSIDEKMLSQKSGKLQGKTIVISGVFHKISREDLKDLIELNGGKVSSSVSKKTDFIVAGENMGPAKLEKAKELGVKILSEDEFFTLLEQ